MKIGISNIVSAFDDITIGTKVINRDKFLTDLSKEVEEFDFSSCRVPGQGYISLADSFIPLVSSGVGKKTNNPEDYVIRFYREKVSLYLKRQFASKVNNVAVVVYTKKAYLNDHDITEDEIFLLNSNKDITHMLVAVLASSDVEQQLSPYRFTHNLAGGNNEAKLWTADEIRRKAKEIIDYSLNWCIVSD